MEKVFFNNGFKNKKIIKSFLSKYLESQKPNKIINLWGAIEDPFTEIVSEIKESKILCNNEQFCKMLEEKYPGKVIDGDPLHTIDEINEKADVLIGNFPMRVKPKEILVDNIKIRDSVGVLIIAKAIKNLSKDGKGIFVVPPSFFSSSRSNVFASQINKLGAYVEAAISIPEGSLYNTSFPALIIIVSKSKSEKLFIAELPKEEDQLLELINNLTNHMRGETESLGDLVNEQDFSHYASYVASKEIELLLKHYKDFKLHTMKDLALEINTTKDLFTEKPNSLYLPKIGNSEALYDIQRLKLKPQYYYQIVLNQKIVMATYLAQFFNTPLGRKLRKSIQSGIVIQKISKQDITKLFKKDINSSFNIPLPELNLQKSIIAVKAKLIHLQNQLKIYEENLATAPKNVLEIEKKLKSITEAIEDANLEDRVLQLIRKGESKKLEFKSTLTINLHTNNPDKKMEHAVLKTITAFLNTEGGTLLVGVEDNGNILGIEADKFPNKDKFLLHFKNLVKDKIGLEFTPLIESEICKSNGKNVLIVDCKSSNKPVFLKTKEREDFYIRTNPSSDKLDGSKLVEYINRRFN